MKKLLLNSIVLLTSIHCFAEVNADNKLWSKANAYYVAKQYDSAIITYQKIANSNTFSDILHFNLGNAYYKNNNLGMASLSYQRALFINPDFKNAADNLSLTESRIPNRIKQSPDIFFMRWWTKISASNTANFWSVLSLITFSFLLIGIFVQVTKKMNRPIPSQVFFIITLFNLLFLYIAYSASCHKSESNLAVVIINSANMLVEPNVYKGQVLVPEATSLKIEDEKGNWIKVTLPDNRTGWIQNQDIAFVHRLRKK